MPIQVRSLEHAALHKAELYNPELISEPLGGQGVWNGAFDFWRDGLPVGWEVYYDNATSTFSQQSTGIAGLYCVRGGNSAAQVRGTYMIQRAYMPVDNDRDYNIHGAFKGSAAGCTIRFGAACYSSAKAYLGLSLTRSGVAPGVAWVRYDDVIGPGGTAWVASTRYARVYIFLQYANNQAAGVYVDADDVFWRPEP